MTEPQTPQELHDGTQSPQRNTVEIGGVKYYIDSLSETALNKVRNIQIIEKQLQEKQQKIDDITLDMNIFNIAIMRLMEDVQGLISEFEEA